MEEFTQGTLIRYIRSKKYAGIKCIGVVITARCDLANDKVNQFYCLSAMGLEEWIYEILFSKILQEKKKNILGDIRKCCKDKELDYESLSQMELNDIDKIIHSYCSDKEYKRIGAKIEEWKNLQQYESTKITRSEKKQFLKKNKKEVKNKLKFLYKGNFTKYVALPGKAYSENGAAVSGLVVDLQDIIPFDISFKNDIVKCKYDYLELKDDQKKNEINQMFFFESDDDVVIGVEQLSSPWIEYIMQWFGNSFMRIGVDNVTDAEIEAYCDDVLGENE